MSKLSWRKQHDHKKINPANIAKETTPTYALKHVFDIIQYNAINICSAPIQNKSCSKARSLCVIPLVIILREKISFKSGFELIQGC